MRVIQRLLAALGAASLAIAAPTMTKTTSSPTAKATCTQSTRTANFATLPLGPIDSKLNYGGLTFEGFSVVATKDTYWYDFGETHMIQMDADMGYIKAAGGHLNGWQLAEANGPTIYMGCQNTTLHPVKSCDCQFGTEWLVRGYTKAQNAYYQTYSGVYDPHQYDFDGLHSLEGGGSGNVAFSYDAVWSIYGSAGAPLPSYDAGVKLYLANFTYVLQECHY